ncbi:MAG: hypothetical protein IIY93_01655, partial [Clostridia bacterium]|nr:hypothetical protein [Clostridia bacterium]
MTDALVAIPKVMETLLTVLEQQPFQYFVEEAAQNVAETVIVRYIVPKIKNCHDDFKKFYNEKIKGNLDDNIIQVLTKL